MDLFTLCCTTIVCGVLLCYIVAYLLHGRPIECPSTVRMDHRTVLITGKAMVYVN